MFDTITLPIRDLEVPQFLKIRSDLLAKGIHESEELDQTRGVFIFTFVVGQVRFKLSFQKVLPVSLGSWDFALALSLDTLFPLWRKPDAKSANIETVAISWPTASPKRGKSGSRMSPVTISPFMIGLLF